MNARFNKLTPCSAAVEAATEADRDYFEAHPDVTSYVRRRRAGESSPLASSQWVKVNLVAWDDRRRMVLTYADLPSMS